MQLEIRQQRIQKMAATPFIRASAAAVAVNKSEGITRHDHFQRKQTEKAEKWETRTAIVIKPAGQVVCLGKLPFRPQTRRMVLVFLPLRDLFALARSSKPLNSIYNFGIDLARDSVAVFIRSPQISVVQIGSPAAAAHLQVGDRIVKVDGVRVSTNVDIVRQYLAADRVLQVEYKRPKGRELFSVAHVPVWDSETLPEIPQTATGFIDLDGADNQLSRITWVAEAVAHGCSSNGSIAVIRGRLKEKLQSRHMRQTAGYGNSRSSFTYLHTFPSPNIRPPSLNELMPPPMPPPPPPPPPTLPMPPTTMPTLPTTAASSPARTHQAATHAPSPLPAPAPAKKRHAPPKSPPRVESPPQPPPSQERRKRTAREQQQPQHEPLLVPAQSRSRSGRLLTTTWQSRAGLGFKRD